MPSVSRIRHVDGRFDYRRLIEDAVASVDCRTATGGRRGSRPPMLPLERLGRDLLNAQFGDHEAYGMRWDPDRASPLVNVPFDRAIGGRVPINALLAAIMLSRTDLLAVYDDQGVFDLESAVRWLVLRGINEHRMWHAADDRFVSALTEATLSTPWGMMSPLQAIVLADRPTLATQVGKRGATSALAALSDWIDTTGMEAFGLEWLSPPKRAESSGPAGLVQTVDAMGTSWAQRLEAVQQALGGRSHARSVHVFKRTSPIAVSIVDGAVIEAPGVGYFLKTPYLRLALPSEMATGQLFIEFENVPDGAWLSARANESATESTVSHHHGCTVLKIKPSTARAIAAGLRIIDLSVDLQERETPAATFGKIMRLWHI